MMLHISVSGHNQVSLLEVKGRIDSNTANQLGETLAAQISEGQVFLVLDLAGVEYMSSAGLREIINALKQVRGRGDLRLAQPTQRVKDVLEMAGVHTILQIYPTRTAALESY